MENPKFASQEFMIIPISKAKTTIVEPPAKVKPEVETLTTTEADTLEDSHVYVHCYFNNTYKDMLIRIWRSTFLIDRSSGTRSRLVHAENISYAPQWTLIPDNSVYRFLLIFEALPRSCQLFDLLEDIPQSGGFFIQDILRNEKDVYHVDI